MNIVDLLKDTLCGTASGVAQVITMMPLENIITKMITKPQEYRGFIQATIKTVKQEGIFSFYKGMLMPLIGVGFQVSLQFAVVETLKKAMKANFANQEGKLSFPIIMLCGALASIPSTITVTPLDHARFRVLMNKSNDGPGSVRVAYDILKTHGIRKLYLGFNSTLLREAIGLSLYFGTYDLILPILLENKIDIAKAAFYAGGIAGLATWALIYPIHYVKVKIQCDDLQNPKYKSSIQCAMQLVKNKQMIKAYKGVQWMLLRAFLVNGAGFVGFEKMKKFLYKNDL